METCDKCEITENTRIISGNVCILKSVTPCDECVERDKAEQKRLRYERYKDYTKEELVDEIYELAFALRELREKILSIAEYDV